MQPSDANTNPNDGHGAEPSPGSESSSAPERPEVRFEPRDVKFRWVLILAVAGCGVGAGIFMLVRAFYWTAIESRTARPSTAFAPYEQPMSQLPPEPRLELLDRLEKTPASNVSKWEKGEEQALETYGATNEKGFVRIPLERAMQTLAGHLPARKPADRPKFKDHGLVDGGESNSGRMFRGAPQ
jgi:hypothetical protein